MEQKKITLRELIETLPDNYLFKIGTSGGSGFFFCGTKEQFYEGAEKYQKDLPRAKGFTEAEVTDYYKADRCVEPDPTYIIIIWGEIGGSYWTCSEAKEATPYAVKGKNGRPVSRKKKNRPITKTKKCCRNCQFWRQVDNDYCPKASKPVTSPNKSKCPLWTERGWYT